MNCMSQIVVKEAKDVKRIKNEVAALQKAKSVQVKKTDEGFALYASLSPADLQQLLDIYSNETIIINESAHCSHKSEQTLHSITEDYLRHVLKLPSELCAQLCSNLPKRWSIYTPMVLLNAGSYDTEIWQKILLENNMDAYFNAIRPLFQENVTHFAVNKPIIKEDIMRRPFNLLPLHGDFGALPTHHTCTSPTQQDLDLGFWCHTIQNKIYQTWAPCYTMFSRGNIREKRRLLVDFPRLDGTHVVDLYAGIGYFSLSYLANGATLFCWEINRWSVEGLLRGLKMNKHKYHLVQEHEELTGNVFQTLVENGVKAFVFFESNEYASRRLSKLNTLSVSHINLGLLPTLKSSWPIALEIAQKSSICSIIHIHENVHCNQFESLILEVAHYFSGTVSLEKVKTFAPDVWHVVVDVKQGAQKDTQV